MPYLHLPVQSGSDRILKAMNRSHTAADYLALIERIRAARPDIALSGDFIVGFPGETRSRFRGDAAIWCARSATPQAFSFKYSPRPARPAPTWTDQVPEAVKDERLQRLQALLLNSSSDFGRCLVGRDASMCCSRSRAARPASWSAARLSCSRLLLMKRPAKSVTLSRCESPKPGSQQPVIAGIGLHGAVPGSIEERRFERHGS